MAQVLSAESAARVTVAAAAVEAQHMAERARAAARGIAERTQRRLHRVRAAFERAADAEVAALHAQGEALRAPRAIGADDLARIDRAVTRLAARLTGAPP
jgi:hypothetical protein